jgi:hypothetical protein
MHHRAVVQRLRQAPKLHVRPYHFASPGFHAALLPAVAAEREPLRAAATHALNGFDKAKWHSSPVATVLEGNILDGGTRVDTLDAFGLANGSQLLAAPSELDRLIDHATGFVPARADLRTAVRAAEAALLSPAMAGELIANQTLDFGKQDGVTEIEEAIQANPVEQRLNDQLWDSEAAGRVVIPRRIALVPCVSNFSHFLDMCRKTLRNIELGIPVMVLSRNHTSQYPYRWVIALVDQLKAHGVDSRYLTFCSADLSSQQALIKAAAAAAAADTTMADAPPSPPFLFTGARQLAETIKRDVAGGMIASTQGPNLMVALGLPNSVAAAAAMSATIENSGQCTALRVLVAPGAEATPATVEAMFDTTSGGGDAPGYLAAGEFAGLLEPPPMSMEGGAPITPAGYTAHPSTARVSYRVRPDLPAPPGAEESAFEEHWRQVVLDVVAPPALTDDFVDSIGGWLVKHQPITLTVNGATGNAEHSASPTPPEHYAVARRIFERSAQCVYTIGDADIPALSAQARPQDGEVFGELPPLHMMTDVTRFPMIVPSAQAAYFSHYSRDHLERLGAEASGSGGALGAIVGAASEPTVKGYIVELADYLRDAAVGPRRSHAARTCLYGLQRPPLDGKLTAIRCGAATTLDEVLPFVLPFALTNAAEQAVLSVDPTNHGLLDELKTLDASVGKPLAGIEMWTRTEAEHAGDAVQSTLARTVRPDVLSAEHPFPLAQQFVSRLVTLGHVKSTRSDDHHFLATFEASPKWLRFDASRA